MGKMIREEMGRRKDRILCQADQGDRRDDTGEMTGEMGALREPRRILGMVGVGHGHRHRPGAPDLGMGERGMDAAERDDDGQRQGDRQDAREKTAAALREPHERAGCCNPVHGLHIAIGEGLCPGRAGRA